MKIKNRKYFVIDFNNILKKTHKEIVSSENAKRLARSEIEKIIKFGLKSNDLQKNKSCFYNGGWTWYQINATYQKNT